ncbi:DUF2975 domain-containing protein [Gracilibacillus alcaliphilus]|uniref:DUF2975 domain-containing protein n=1 Tax=Gracilibacillus alcaliphilus TaxID=1401441 RepID=UPI00195BAE38|nr:DUF2975 domain-containing protein [Gracilibacillus alcaliphilus]MBM7677489.1 hypothetical protein [Gracilibacillus alcaliphilus]
MDQVMVTRMRNRSKTMWKMLQVGTGLVIVFLIYTVGLSVWALFLPESVFEAKSGVDSWWISGQWEFVFFTAIIPFEILPTLGSQMFDIQSAYITYMIFYGSTSALPLLYGIKQVKTILTSIAEGSTPFSAQNVNCLKKLAFVLLFYGFFAKLIINLAMTVFVTQTLSIGVAAIFHYFSFFTGLLLLIVAQVFQYGLSLQEESDETV